MSSIVYTPSPTPTNPSEGEVYYDSTSKELKVYGNSSSFEKIHDETVEPHIVTKKLYPSYVASGTANKLLDGVTNHSGAFGTEQADGRMYYYTNIAGSKPIHDPRIGAHFGSQRHKIKSLQILEQETATHKNNVYSVDGREWMRAVGAWIVDYSSSGSGMYVSNSNSNGSDYIEIVGYFSDAFIVEYASTTHDKTVSVDGTIVGSNPNTSATTTASNPLAGRYVDSGSVINLALGQTLGIHTLKIASVNGDYLGSFFGIDLIAQDTTSATTKSQVQIPAQTVVSFGKKRSISAETKHYNPFAFKTDGSTAWTAGNHNGTSLPIGTGSSHNIDVATSLGLEKWKHSSNYYYPYNGMRVVRWVDENGVVKTSVTCMPPNAKSIADSASLGNANAKANASVANDTFYPTFEAHTTSVNEDNLHEIAKTFHWREFGNGAANGGSYTTAGTWADASMLYSGDDIVYVMDDGLSSLSANDVTPLVTPADALNLGANDTVHITFIGTGISIYSPNWAENANAWHHIAQNLPYGSHIIKISRDGSSNCTIVLDGIEVKGSTSTAPWKNPSELSFFQPKRPPIPDSACVLADYMVFADFKPQTAAGIHLISKGVRSVSASRDFFINDTGSNTLALDPSATHKSGFKISSSATSDSDTTITFRLPSFGTNYVSRGVEHDTRKKLFLDTTDKDSDSTKNNASSGSYAHLTANLDLGVYKFGTNIVNGQYPIFEGFDVVTPTHTSHHYQPFETPFLHELIGGDRSMEQTNLICSSDGRSWDEITRDTSYIGRSVVSSNQTADTWFNDNTNAVFDRQRGGAQGEQSDSLGSANYCKDSFVVAQDKYICLKDGQYKISVRFLARASHSTIIKLNGTRTAGHHHDHSNYSSSVLMDTLQLKRGDIVLVYDEIHGGVWSHFYIEKV